MVEEISPADLRQRLADGEDVQVVDIRSPDEFADGHIPGAENLPFDEFTERVEEFDWGAEVVLACPVGQSSRQAGRLLESFAGSGDARVLNLSGGYEAWSYDLERE